MNEPTQIRLSSGTKQRLAHIAEQESMEFEEAVEWALRAGLNLFHAEVHAEVPEPFEIRGRSVPLKLGIVRRLQWRVLALFYRKRRRSS